MWVEYLRLGILYNLYTCWISSTLLNIFPDGIKFCWNLVLVHVESWILRTPKSYNFMRSFPSIDYSNIEPFQLWTVPFQHRITLTWYCFNSGPLQLGIVPTVDFRQATAPTMLFMAMDSATDCWHRDLMQKGHPRSPGSGGYGSW